MNFESEKKQRAAQEKFDAWAPYYEDGIWSKYFFASERYILDNIHIRNGTTVIDLGCGTGHFGKVLVQLLDRINYVGIDSSTEMVKNARKWLHDTPQPLAKLDFVHAVIPPIPRPNESADYIVTLNTFHHFFDQQKVVREAFRVLKPGGVFIVLDAFSDNILRKLWTRFLDFHHVERGTEYLSRKKICNLLDHAGFNDIAQRRYLYFALVTIGTKSEK